MQQQWAFSNYLHRGINAIGYQAITTRTIQVYNKRTLTNTWITNVDRNLNKPKGKRSLLLLFLAGDTHITFIAVIITHFFVQQHEKMTSHVIVTTVSRERNLLMLRQLWLGYYYWKYYGFSLISKSI